jgi:hypothetical protein
VSDIVSKVDADQTRALLPLPGAFSVSVGTGLFIFSLELTQTDDVIWVGDASIDQGTAR